MKCDEKNTVPSEERGAIEGGRRDYKERRDQRSRTRSEKGRRENRGDVIRGGAIRRRR